jgi:hypothetical protein
MAGAARHPMFSMLLIILAQHSANMRNLGPLQG